MNNGLQTIRFWNPLFPQIYMRDTAGGIASEPTECTSSQIVKYQKEIEAAIQQQLLEKNPQGLAVYPEEELTQKVHSMIPSVEAYAGHLWGVTTIQVYCKLTEVELEELAGELHEQFYDGWGDDFERYPIMVAEGELYLRFWSCDNRSFVREESEMLRELSEYPQRYMS